MQYESYFLRKLAHLVLLLISLLLQKMIAKLKNVLCAKEERNYQ